ncbi:MAG: PilZ domain-containing protein [Syntrophobacteria bacterium]
MSKERRRDNRATIDWAVLVRDTGGIIVADIENISLSGAFIRCNVPLETKKRYKLHIMVPNHSPLDTNAEVAWLSVKCTERGIPPCGMGIRFTRVSKSDREIINGHILQSPRSKYY